MGRTIKVALCLPWYAGPDPDCAGAFLMFQHYLGRLQERMWWYARVFNPGGPGAVKDIPPLDSADPTAEIPESLLGTRIEFVLVPVIGYSLPGTARAIAVEAALNAGADYILFYDDDMIFMPGVFLKLLAHDLPVVGALAFTARDPITPVIYKFTETPRGRRCDPILDYKRDQLQQVDAIGFGVVLIQATVFRKLPKPWFSIPGSGEDIQFCDECRKYKIPVYVDTSAKTVHKPRYTPEWNSEEKFLRERAADLEKLK